SFWILSDTHSRFIQKVAKADASIHRADQNVLSGYNFGERPIGGPWSNTVHSFQAAVRCNIRLKAKVTDVCFGSKADICSAFTHVRFTPESECDKWNVR